jgi:peptidoglycan/LPS O-acetylase OafA/YrhL
MPSPSYRPEIDGLRALAIALVVFYHVEFIWGNHHFLPGGFIGVDVFFVISGYLITRIIGRDMRQGGGSLTHFFERRIRRIMPILLTVMGCSLVPAWFLLNPQEAREFGTSILSALGFISNIWFWRENSYWAVASEFKPFLHTWSLSVEEQFYILYPLVLIVINRFMPKYLWAWMAAGFALSLGIAQYAASFNPTAGFYLLPARGWELLAGAMIAQRELSKPLAAAAPAAWTGWVFPAAGLAMIVASAFLFSARTPHPSWLTLFPVAGTMMIIQFARPDAGIGKWMSIRPLVGLGLISYGLYLWHYPVFVLGRMAHGGISPWVFAAFALGLSVATYFLIEKPARNSARIRTAHLFIALGVAATIVVAACAGASLSRGLWGRFDDWQIRLLAMDDPSQPDFAVYTNQEYSRHDRDTFPDIPGQKKLLIIGDSFSQDFFNILSEGGWLEGVNVVTHIVPFQCQNVPFDADYQDKIPAAYAARCEKVVRVGHPDLTPLVTSADMVIVAAAWNKYTVSKLPALHDILKKQTRAPVLIVGRKFFYHAPLRELLFYRSLDALEKSVTIAEEQTTIDDIKASQAAIPAQDFLNLQTVACGTDMACPVAAPNGRAISFDGRHLTRDGAVYIAEKLKEDAAFSRKWRAVFGR